MADINYMDKVGLSIFFKNLKALFATKNELKVNSDGTAEVLQDTEPTGQEKGDFWLQQY